MHCSLVLLLKCIATIIYHAIATLSLIQTNAVELEAWKSTSIFCRSSASYNVITNWFCHKLLALLIAQAISNRLLNSLMSTLGDSS